MRLKQESNAWLVVTISSCEAIPISFESHGCESLLRCDATMAWLSLLRPSAHPSFVPWINHHQILSLSYWILISLGRARVSSPPSYVCDCHSSLAVGPIVWNPQPHEHTTLPSYLIQRSLTLYLGAHLHHWGSPTSNHILIPCPLSLFSRVLRAWPSFDVGTPIRPTPHVPLLLFSSSFPHPSQPWFPHIPRILLCVPFTTVVPLLVLPDLLQFYFTGDTDPWMVSPQRMKAVE